MASSLTSTTLTINDINITEVINNAAYPVGSIYIQLKGKSSPSDLHLGGSNATWTDVSKSYADRYFGVAGTNLKYGTDYNDGLPNITGNFNIVGDGGVGAYMNSNASGAFGRYWLTQTDGWTTGKNQNGAYGVDFYASRSSSIYGSATFVRPKTSVVKVWERTEYYSVRCLNTKLRNSINAISYKNNLLEVA